MIWVINPLKTIAFDIGPCKFQKQTIPADNRRSSAVELKLPAHASCLDGHFYLHKLSDPLLIYTWEILLAP